MTAHGREHASAVECETQDQEESYGSLVSVADFLRARAHKIRLDGFRVDATLTPHVCHDARIFPAVTFLRISLFGRFIAASLPRRKGGVKALGFILLLAGWALVLAAIILLMPGAPRGAFVLAGMGVEIVGMVLVIRAHIIPAGSRE